LVDENGRFINDKGEFIDKNGNLVDQSGDYIVEFSPFLDENGKPIILNESESIKETKSDAQQPEEVKDNPSSS
jgi:hypothetical protein